MAKESDIPDDELELLKGAFGGAKKAPSKSEKQKPPKKKKEKPKEKCPYCGEEFISVGRHLPHCDLNPENIPLQPVQPPKAERSGVEIPTGKTTTRRRMVIEEEIIEQADWSQLILEGVKTLRSLSEYLRDIKDEGIKIQLTNK
mgnify:CR=1 FL=1